jgi:ABC-type uncharacterized transport system involved in gliding motility auxiliary subunit
MANKILNIVGWVGTALVIAALGIRFGMPARDQYAFYLAWGGLVCILAYMLSQWREFAKMFTRRQARYGTLTTVSVIVVLGILVAINYIGKRQSKRWDLTASKQYSLSDQTRNILSKLDAPLKISVFVQETAFQEFRDRLREYEYGSKQVSTEYIDPDKKPTVAQQNQVQQYGTIVFNFKGRTERVTTNTEQDITNGIIKVVTGKQRKIYFTQGHGEKDTTASDRSGYSGIAAALTSDNYTADKVILAQSPVVPPDAAVVIVAGPKVDFLAGEVEALKTYLGKSGKLLLELDPPDKADGAPLTNLIALAHDWGVDIGNDVVVDVSGMGQLLGTDNSVPVAASYPSHPITERFSVFTAYPMARSATPVKGGVNGHTAQTIVESSPRSWAETDVKALMTTGKVQLDAGKDKAGPVSLAAAVSAGAAPPDPSKPEDAGAPKPETRVVVYGDSDFAANAGLGIQGNRDLFMNTIGWLSQQENLISIRAKSADDRRLTLTSAQQTNIMWITLLGIPAAVFAVGILTWRRRRA